MGVIVAFAWCWDSSSSSPKLLSPSFLALFSFSLLPSLL